ncbi:hypothetical protein BCR42DRAFT_452628 [Absidia repens]|uniref:RNA polymerase II elongation factor ELL N-terminal domain-containing protein n=1 Tax=Absidia repens TaxID=90262 RepID=A0A1X2ICU6_9FUNG|nr:hypothetical protein BCR42DRAFT_452628 [Absidia repens]
MTNKKQVFSVRLNRDAYNMIMQQPQSMRLELGDSSSFMFIDDRPFDLNLQREQSTIQVYEKNQRTRQDDDDRIQYVGDITHAGHMKQVLSKEDKKRVRSRTEQIEKEKNARRIELLDVPSIPTPTKIHGNITPTATFSPAKRNNLLSPSATKNTSSSPSSKSITSTALSSSPVSLASGSLDGSRLEGAALQSLRERLIHLLALDPRPTDQLTQMLKVASVDLLPLLKKVAVFTNSIWCLRPETFKEIRIWEWTRYDDKERSTVCRKAEEAYDFLKLPRNAPERANLLQRKSRKPSPKLIPPPSQHTPTLGSSSTSGHSIKNGSHTSLSDTPMSSNRKHGRAGTLEHNNGKSSTTKKRKVEKSAKPKSSESSHPLPSSKLSASASVSPANLTPSKKPHHETKKQKPLTVHRSMAKDSTLHDLSSTDHDDDDDYEGTDRRRTGGKTYVAPTIQTQMEFDMLCKEHYDTQQDYIQFKKTFVQNHPIYIQALTAVNEQDKELFARKLKAYYKSKGGDMNKWRQLMHLSRRFNGTHAKINAMWDTIEKAYRQKRFTLRLNRIASSSSSASSASSSLSPLSSSSPLPPPRSSHRG